MIVDGTLDRLIIFLLLTALKHKNNLWTFVGSVEAAQAGQSHPQAMPQLSSQMGLDMPQGVNPGLGISGQNAPAAPTVATVAPNTQPGPHMVRTPGAVPPPNQNNLAFQVVSYYQFVLLAFVIWLLPNSAHYFKKNVDSKYSKWPFHRIGPAL